MNRGGAARPRHAVGRLRRGRSAGGGGGSGDEHRYYLIPQNCGALTRTYDHLLPSHPLNQPLFVYGMWTRTSSPIPKRLFSSYCLLLVGFPPRPNCPKDPSKPTRPDYYHSQPQPYPWQTFEKLKSSNRSPQ